MSRKVIVFVPARMGSKRFPGKCLHKIGKFPLICWTYAQARMTGYASIVVTPDEEIRESLLNDRKIPCFLTSDDPINGSERCGDAVSNPIFDTMEDEDIIINIQGDMVKFDYSCVKDMVNLLTTEKVDYATAFCQLPDGAQSNPNRVKCTIRFDELLDTLLVDKFSRYSIPDKANYLHVGMYGFTKKSLNRYCRWSPSNNELTMRLEQMRILDNNYQIGGVIASEIPVTIDCPADVCLAEKEIENFECSMPI